MIRTRLLFEVSVTSLLLASSAAALRSSAPPVVLVEKRGSIQNAIDVVELQREPRQIQQASFEDRDRSGNFYVVDIWKKSSERWQLIARYSSPMGKKFDRTVPL